MQAIVEWLRVQNFVPFYSNIFSTTESLKKDSQDQSVFHYSKSFSDNTIFEYSLQDKPSCLFIWNTWLCKSLHDIGTKQVCVSGSADVLTYDQNIFKGTTQDQMTKLTTQIMHLNVCGFEFLWFRQSFKMSEYVSLLYSSSSS